MFKMLEARDLTKRFSRLTVVDGVSFSIRPGEILGYLGPNGSGKSTTVKMLTGLLSPSKGELLFRGQWIAARFLNTYRAQGQLDLPAQRVQGQYWAISAVKKILLTVVIVPVSAMTVFILAGWIGLAGSFLQAVFVLLMCLVLLEALLWNWNQRFCLA